MQITIELTYLGSDLRNVDIPEITSWDQIKEWYVKWGVFYYSLDGENFHSVNVSHGDEFDTKRPCMVRITDLQNNTYCEVEGHFSKDAF